MIEGSIVALVTPMHPDGALDSRGLEKLIDFHIEQGTDAIVVMGTTGESATLNEDDHCDVIRQSVDIAAGRIPVIAGTGSNSTQEAIDLTDCAAAAGADACLLVAPYYNKPTQEGLYLHHKAIAEAVDIPQILYNVPGRTVCDLLPETVERLAPLDNIVGIKEATGDLDRAKDIMRRCGDDFYVYSGDDAMAMELILAGAKGNISVTANVAPKAMHAMCVAAAAGNRREAEAIDNTVARLHELLFVEANPIPVKWALHHMGYISEGIRLPMTVLSERYRTPLTQALNDAGLL
ncbi:MAG TPA: 4-hydroxy-tetrahydrodipicolinate synthase [Chromatiaceae bacterium]|jgi:4-hydroxy-tetrahydrodipicolinate synthase|nr:4-hydroxy-tetrahydrodipicolinate synthase [Chromatiaceae bacterium]HIN82643.1 4-hydroxy-tetrahydrodipicolinate synthase [Chromatiales bacterium]HIA08114.1 4-hydroxy-tetrahydrodipicolinate synthase [Chromatiaceae bacterium]HIB85423.1 4-hydroxy-tetrahydrodipicolinate synthase [Chromatiaceae bacterium]HIO14839.1 4-hydroxy-tetrahydrodipicolinate synthase [Chromatiales bacterium]